MSNGLEFLSQNLDILVARDVGFDFTSWICQQTVSLAADGFLYQKCPVTCHVSLVSFH